MKIDPTIYAGCLAAAGSVHASSSLQPRKVDIVAYADQLYAVVMRQHPELKRSTETHAG